MSDENSDTEVPYAVSQRDPARNIFPTTVGRLVVTGRSDVSIFRWIVNDFPLLLRGGKIPFSN